MTQPLAEAILHRGTLILEPIVPAHADAIFEAIQAPSLYTYIPQEPPSDLSVLRTRYTRWAQRASPDGSEIWLNYAVREQGNPQYVGTVQATVAAKTYIAYEIFPPFWRRGFARSACKTLLAHLFRSWALEEVHALVDTRNVASWRLLETLGFQRTGMIPNADHFKGATSDEYAYVLTRAPENP
jgi:RimJ/RimL family protein N-acetyltransferase